MGYGLLSMSRLGSGAVATVTDTVQIIDVAIVVPISIAGFAVWVRVRLSVSHRQTQEGLIIDLKPSF
jgi:hypothetical protein